MMRDRDKYIGAFGVRGLDAAIQDLTEDCLKLIGYTAERRHKPGIKGYLIRFGMPALLPGPNVAGLQSYRAVPTLRTDDPMYPAVKHILSSVPVGVGRAFRSWPSPPTGDFVHRLRLAVAWVAKALRLGAI